MHLPGHAEHKPKAAFQHLEKKYFEVGDLGFRVWRYMDTITGMLICNDRRWPEAFRVLALQGAEIVALGFNTPDREPALQRAAGAARAPPPDHGAVDGVPERHLAGRDRQGRRSRTAFACSATR